MVITVIVILAAIALAMAVYHAKDKEERKKLLISIAVAFAIIFGYLAVLNGRYGETSQTTFDKWSRHDVLIEWFE